MRPRFPAEMSMRMLLKPLDLDPRLLRLILPMLTALVRRVVP